MSGRRDALIDRGQLIAGVGLLCVAVFIWIAFEFGQIRAGHNRLEAIEAYNDLETVLDEERETSEQLRERIARLETDRKIDREAYARVERELKSLEAEILAQQEDLEFYRGIVADQQGGLRVQDLVLWPGEQELAYSMRLVLAQPMRAGSRISGSVQLEIEGRQDAEARTLKLREVTVGGKSRLDFSFRYFQNLETELVLPEGFTPTQVHLKLTPSGKSAQSVEKSFEWVVKAG